MTETPEPSRAELYLQVIRAVPVGKVVTYGQVAELAGFPGRARQVGQVLRDLPEASDVPWHRVINAQGEVAYRASPRDELIQRELLEDEGIVFTDAGRVDLKRYGWAPRVILRP